MKIEIKCDIVLASGARASLFFDPETNIAYWSSHTEHGNFHCMWDSHIKAFGFNCLVEERFIAHKDKYWINAAANYAKILSDQADKVLLNE